jgi:hypothetical protein
MMMLLEGGLRCCVVIFVISLMQPHYVDCVVRGLFLN